MTPEPTGIEAELCRMIAERQQKGVATYGMTLEQNPISAKDVLKEMVCEQLDGAAYGMKAIRQIEKMQAKIAVLESALREIHLEVDGYVDGAPDRSEISSLANRVQVIIDALK